MRSLCERADIIVPNLTEAALLLGEPYQAGPYTKAYIDGILHKLSQLGPKQVVLTVSISTRKNWEPPLSIWNEMRQSMF